MVITFICGSLEAGRDGVGDYTRRLAGELVRQGHEVSVVAVYDAYSSAIVAAYQETENVLLPVLRIAAATTDKDRFGVLKSWLDEKNPDWVSLQFVPFAFHAKGLPHTLYNRLSNVWTGHNWHIMFHELWVGMEAKAPGKLWFWGQLQKRIIVSLLKGLNPAIVHTQTLLYQSQLARLGFGPKYLPLFGNIPVTAPPYDNRRSGATEGPLKFVLFGGIHQGVPVDEFAREVALYAKVTKRKAILQLVGRNGAEQETWARAWCAAGLQLEILGELPARHVSEVLAQATVGLATTPIALMEKSGSVAAMREHGLSVLCVRTPWETAGIDDITPLSGIIQYRVGNFKDCLCQIRNVETNSMLKDVAAKFADDLVQANRQTIVKREPALL